MSSTIFMGTTKVPPERTANEIAERLRAAKVDYINNEYVNGEIVAVRFCIKRADQELWYCLPVRWEAVHRAMKKRARHYWDDKDQAKRTAWRQVLRWVEAQLALVEVGQTSAFEIFLPYMHMDGQRTVGEIFAEKYNTPLLPAGTAT